MYGGGIFETGQAMVPYTTLQGHVLGRQNRRVPGKAEDVPLVEFMYLALTRMPGGNYRNYSGLCSCVCVTSFDR